MAKEFSRSQRVGDHIQKKLAAIIQMSVRDSGLGLVTISAIDLSTDLSRAKIYVTCLGIDMDSIGISNREKILAMLNDNAPQFRHQLSKTLTTRIVPKLKFIFDESLQQSNRLIGLIDSLHTNDPQN